MFDYDLKGICRPHIVIVLLAGTILSVSNMPCALKDTCVLDTTADKIMFTLSFPTLSVSLDGGTWSHL